jgi:hypothetical protein
MKGPGPLDVSLGDCMSANRRISVGVVLTAVGLVAGWSTGACRTYAQIEHRISTVEQSERQHSSEFRELHDDVREIRTDVKHLLERRD